ncbi:hypothetical protein Cni_G06763 [Canna indica]|uniref:Reverse transcriptase domain-containing protein n=1 Tax=Canna indica TaxID=4628 RepID=A0AAQ3JZ61_9LILI|nr:hypothetical protein Cni_G06763 [Canna indica]
MNQFRPISLCNILYKIASKVLTNSLKRILLDIISDFHSAFVPGRVITDNIIVAHEITHHLHNKRQGRRGSFALKLDMSKAYDRVEWQCLLAIMRKIGLEGVFLNWFWNCISTVVLVNGKQGKRFLPSKGLRQDEASMMWKGLIRELFHPYEQNKILSIPLSARRPPDENIWMFEKHGHL